MEIFLLALLKRESETLFNFVFARGMWLLKVSTGIGTTRPCRTNFTCMLNSPSKKNSILQDKRPLN